MTRYTEMIAVAVDSARRAVKEDMEPNIALTLDRKGTKRSAQPYIPKSESQIQPLLERFLASKRVDGVVEHVARLGGGGSKEQFTFELRRPESGSARYVLRIDPAQSAVETDRVREFEILRAMRATVPVPEPQWIDSDGTYFGTPAIVMRFVQGTTKPGDKLANVSGLGIAFGDGLRERLPGQFLDHLAAIHGLDWRSANLPSFQAPVGDVFQAARWQVNWWSRVWREDSVESMPAIAVAEQWLRDHLPPCDELVLVHGDFRSGNFLFDPATERITAILDWELAHIGDYHQDLGYILLSVLGTRENGISYATGLFERDRFLREYSARTGRRVDPMRLHFYEVLSCYMSVVLALATCVRAAKDGQNHQDTHATWIAVAGHVLLTEMCDLIGRGPTI